MKSTTAIRRIHAATTLALVFTLTAATAPPLHAATILATATGNMNAAATWGNDPAAPPVSGDTNVWDTNGFNINLTSSDTFHGGELLVRAGSILITSANVTTTFQAVTFDNGGIRKHTNVASTYNFSGQTLTFEAGGALFTSNDHNRNIRIDDAVWAGSGPITFRRTAGVGENPSVLDILSSNTLSGYTGTILLLNDTANPARLRFEASNPTTGSFGLNLAPSTQLTLLTDETLIFSSIVVDGTPLGIGTYSRDDLNDAGIGGFFIGSSGAIQVIPEPSALLLGGLGILTLARRRRR